MTRIQGDLAERPLDFGVAILDIVDDLPRSAKGRAILRQLVRSGTSVGANVWEADHAFSESDFAYCCNVARKEAGEKRYWLRLSERASMLRGEKHQKVSQEAEELSRILTTVVAGTRRFVASTKNKNAR